jgi:glutathione S-transferase
VAEYTLYGFAQSGNAYKAALMLELAGADWGKYPNVQGWLARIAATPRWQHPYQLLPGHPRPAAA